MFSDLFATKILRNLGEKLNILPFKAFSAKQLNNFSQAKFTTKGSARKKAVAALTIGALLTGSFLGGVGTPPPPVYAEDTAAEDAYLDVTVPTSYERFAGNSRYETAVQISSKNWFEAYNVVLARGDSFPDALAGAVLANSAVAGGPLLLTESSHLRPDVLQELKRLNASTVFILGGTTAIAADVDKELRNNGIQPYRIQGKDRYETAAGIALVAVENSSKAFLASGTSFADALSISAYAASKGLPLLLTDSKAVPQVTLDALKSMGVAEVTLIGGESVISPAVADQLQKEGYYVTRLSGSNRFATNSAILENLDFNTSQVVVATGMTFPDALAGSVLAAKGNNPVVLVPKDENEFLNTPTASYLNNIRPGVTKFSILGGWSVINYKVENIVRTGKLNPRISLQFWDGYANLERYKQQLSFVPGNLTDYIHILVPNLAGEMKADGSFGYRFGSADNPKYLVSLGQSKGARVVPMVMSSGTIADAMLLDPAKRKTFADSAVKLVQETGADGILVDLEALADNTEQGLTSLMQDLYARLHPQGKLVMISVASKTSPTAQSWYAEYNYRELAKYADYVQIMSYDKHYSTSAPGPIAPLDWVRQVMAYAVTEIPSEKILMGVPYYGRGWKSLGDGKWTSTAFGWAIATETAAKAGATISRATTLTDPIGVPTFKYVDENGDQRTAYFDDRLSWGAKLDLMDEFCLGGIGGWAMGWINEVSAPELYPLLKERFK
ncbi:MAG: cell wall-binding repeat-containing protein [Desulfitobacteriia bacterium]